MIIESKVAGGMVIIPAALIEDQVISDKARVLYLRLALKGNAKNISKEKIAQACGYSAETYKKYEKELELRGWLTIAEKKAKEQDRVTLNYEVEPVDAPPVDVKGAAFNPESKDLKEYIDAYHKFYLAKVEVAPNIDGAQVNAIKRIAEYFSKIVKDGVTIQDQFKAMFDNWLEIDPFLQDQLKPTQIFSNLPNILNQIRNGIARKKQKTGNPTATVKQSYTDKLKDF